MRATQHRAPEWVEEYRTGSGSDRVVLRAQARGAETGPGRYRFRFRIRLAMLAVSSQTS